MKTASLLSILLLAASVAFGARRPIVELTPDAFRFVRLEQRSSASLRAGAAPNAPGLVHTYGVFSFRYSNRPAVTVRAYEAAANGKFNPAFPGYELLNGTEWEPLFIGYCGTGARDFTLQPDTDYEFRILLIRPELSTAKRIRVLLHTQDGSFRSEPFALPK